jgi:hypothetical protein
MTIALEAIMASETPELNIIFQECLEKFPELKDRDIKLMAMRTVKRLEGAKGQNGEGKDVVIVWIPDKLWGLWDTIKPIIYHELSHFIDLHNPDRIFYERADEKSQKLWDLLQGAKAIKCES